MSEHHLNQSQGDEIDLRDIFIALLEDWKILLGAIIVTLALAILYVLSAPTTYTTELTFTHTREGMRSYNKIPGLSYSEENATAEFSQRLASYENFLRFLENSETNRSALLSASKEGSEGNIAIIARDFFNNFRFAPPSDRESTSQIRLTYNQDIIGPELTNAYYIWSLEEYIEVLVARAHRVVDGSIRQNEREMEALLEIYREETQSQILRLTEADQIRLQQLQDRLESEKKALIAKREERIRLLRQAEQVAEQLGITQPTTPRELGRQQGEREIVYAEINSQSGLPLYFMGTEALRTERQVLEENLYEEVKTAEIRELEKEIQVLSHNRQIEAMLGREVESPFIEAYSQLQEKNLLLRTNRITPSDIQVSEVIRWAYQPPAPDSPKRSLILAISLIGGIILGTILVAISRFAKSLQSYRQVAE